MRGTNNNKLLIGIPIFNPTRVIQWKMSESDIVELFKGKKLIKVTENYYTVLTNVFKQNFTCNIGFHLEGRMVRKIEFFRGGDYYIGRDIYDSYLEFQKVLEDFFGRPTKVKSCYYSFWKLDSIEVLHYIYERFSLEEHVEIKII